VHGFSRFGETQFEWGITEVDKPGLIVAWGEYKGEISLALAVLLGSWIVRLGKSLKPALVTVMRYYTDTIAKQFKELKDDLIALRVELTHTKNAASAATDLLQSVKSELLVTQTRMTGVEKAIDRHTDAGLQLARLEGDQKELRAQVSAIDPRVKSLETYRDENEESLRAVRQAVERKKGK
jgi:predicted  nucleic acid-binding Zn-ribbon protein